METMTRVSAVESPVVAFQVDGSFDYEGVRLLGPDIDKLIALTDALLFYCQVARLRTRPVTISEAEGCVGITWSRYAPAVFRDGRMLELIADGQQIDYLTVQESACRESGSTYPQNLNSTSTYGIARAGRSKLLTLRRKRAQYKEAADSAD